MIDCIENIPKKFWLHAYNSLLTFHASQRTALRSFYLMLLRRQYHLWVWDGSATKRIRGDKVRLHRDGKRNIALSLIRYSLGGLIIHFSLSFSKLQCYCIMLRFLTALLDSGKGGQVKKMMRWLYTLHIMLHYFRQSFHFTPSACIVTYHYK